MFDVIIVANGKSARCKTDKLSFNIGQSSVISRTVNAFSGISGITNIILVTESEYEFPNVIKVCGGKTRTESVRCGLEKVKSKYVLIHDGARPFISKNLIEKVMSDTEKYGSSIPFLNSLMPCPNPRIISGTFLPPNINNARAPKSSNSVVPIILLKDYMLVNQIYIT